MPTQQESSLTIEQYRALQHPVELPTSTQLFDFIVETLTAKGLATYDDADPFRNRLPQSGLFLLVPPQPDQLDLAYLMSLVEVNGVHGKNYLDAKSLKNEIKVPTGPYLMVDIEDGKARLNTKPSVSKANILREKRSPYTTWRGIVHAAVFPDVFKSHNMDLVGSRYGSDLVPLLSLHDDTPGLDVDWDDDAYPKWGAPSCGSVIVL